ncbi:DedA family protein [Streptosporangium pseudovulgare]|uniref:Membrane protein n=1 Tax=Streptosporangium pseudovulgare TaxID=35765 RepID=A0ABQ2R6C4_9ACTN|nr:VTT domain-containing protein [Streptosporangium pseudovulgare]GGQ12095.1 membrane protein [Streptosporangium pseudovulgare]
MDLLHNLLDPKWWLGLLGPFATAGVLGIIFAETGLLLGFFLPGDSLLVAAGIFSTAEAATAIPGLEPLSFPLLLVLAPLCAIAGAQLGHHLGATYGRRMFDRPDSRLFKKEYVDKAEHYFQKFGPARAVVLARFIPIVRTFLNPVAGMLGMSRKRFFLWNCIGGIIWTDGMLIFGRLVGSAVPDIDKYILPGALVVILISIIPIILEIVKSRRGGGPGGPAAPGAQGGTGVPGAPDVPGVPGQQGEAGVARPRGRHHRDTSAPWGDGQW